MMKIRGDFVYVGAEHSTRNASIGTLQLVQELSCPMLTQKKKKKKKIQEMKESMQDCEEEEEDIRSDFVHKKIFYE